MRDVRQPRRVVGRPAIERSIRGLIIRTGRFGEHRASSASDRHWAAQVIDALRDLLRIPAQHERRPS